MTNYRNKNPIEVTPSTLDKILNERRGSASALGPAVSLASLVTSVVDLLSLASLRPGPTSFILAQLKPMAGKAAMGLVPLATVALILNGALLGVWFYAYRTNSAWFHAYRQSLREVFRRLPGAVAKLVAPRSRHHRMARHESRAVPPMVFAIWVVSALAGLSALIRLFGTQSFAGVVGNGAGAFVLSLLTGGALAVILAGVLGACYLEFQKDGAVVGATVAGIVISLAVVVTTTSLAPSLPRGAAALKTEAALALMLVMFLCLLPVVEWVNEGVNLYMTIPENLTERAYYPYDRILNPIYCRTILRIEAHGRPVLLATKRDHIYTLVPLPSPGTRMAVRVDTTPFAILDLGALVGCLRKHSSRLKDRHGLIEICIRPSAHPTTTPIVQGIEIEDRVYHYFIQLIFLDPQLGEKLNRTISTELHNMIAAVIEKVRPRDPGHRDVIEDMKYRFNTSGEVVKARERAEYVADMKVLERQKPLFRDYDDSEKRAFAPREQLRQDCEVLAGIRSEVKMVLDDLPNRVTAAFTRLVVEKLAGGGAKIQGSDRETLEQLIGLFNFTVDVLDVKEHETLEAKAKEALDAVSAEVKETRKDFIDADKDAQHFYQDLVAKPSLTSVAQGILKRLGEKE